MSESGSVEILTDPVEETTCTKCSKPLKVAGMQAFSDFTCPHCKAPQVVPVRLGGFLLLEFLGKGGMGAVYRGRDEGLDRDIAVKVMLASFGEDKSFIDTFRREAKAAAALNHPSIVQIYHFGNAKGQPFIAMELLTGGRLDSMIANAQGRGLDEGLVFKIAIDVADGLNAAYGIGIMHGDIKPENILLDSNGVAKVVDFGLASLKGRDTGQDGIWGTPYYIAPEKVRRQPADARSDIYSLGATLYHAITGKPPFDGDTPVDVVKARLENPPPKLSEPFVKKSAPAVSPRKTSKIVITKTKLTRSGSSTEIPSAASLKPEAPTTPRTYKPEVEAIILRMLEPEPSRRYPTYNSLLADLRKVLATIAPLEKTTTIRKQGGKIVLTKPKSGSISVHTPGLGATTAAATTPTSESGKKKKKSRKGLVIAIVIVLLLGIVGGIAGWMSHKKKLAEEARKAAGRAAAAEKTALQSIRDEANTAFGAILASWSNATRGVEAVELSFSRYTNAPAEIAAAVAKLPDAASYNEAVSNLTLSLAQMPSNHMVLTGTVAGLRMTFREVTSSRDALQEDTMTSAKAAPHLATLTNLAPRIRELSAAVSSQYDVVQAPIKTIEELREKIDTTLKQQGDAATKAAAEAADAAKQQAAEAAAKADADAVEKKKAAEIELVKKACQDAAGSVRQNLFVEAAAAFSNAVKDVTIKDAKDLIDAASERYRLLQQLKTYVIEGIAREKVFSYGWIKNNVPTLDIVGADDTAIKIKGGTQFTWDQVSLPQMLRLIKRYVPNPDAPRKQRAQQNLVAAVYYSEVSGGNKVALKTAVDLAAEAARLDENLAPRIKVLLPDLPSGP